VTLFAASNIIGYLIVDNAIVTTLVAILVLTGRSERRDGRRAQRTAARLRARARARRDARRTHRAPEVAAATQELPRYPHAATYTPGTVAVGRPGTDLMPVPDRSPARSR
jgi:hypothetical protein